MKNNYTPYGTPIGSLPNDMIKMDKEDKSVKHKILEEILTDAHNDPKFFENLLEHCGMKTREIMQLYMIWKKKWDWSNDNGYDLGWDATIDKWIKDGYAAEYARLYTDNIHIGVMYQKLIKYEKNNHL